MREVRKSRGAERNFEVKITMVHKRMLILSCCLALGFQFGYAQGPPTPPAPPRAPAPARAAVPPEPPEPPEPPADWDFNFGPDLAFQMKDLGARIRDQVLAQVRGPVNFSRRGPRAPGDDRLYSNGQRALDRSQWDQALQDFTQVAASCGSRADGALYWKGYALNKLGRRDEALATIAELRKSYASSRWLDDAKALEMEVRQATGQNVSPEAQTDEELKLMALNALVRSDPDRALPLLENLLKSAQTPRLKQRALFVLSQSSSTRAQQILEQVARGGGNPDLQLHAINYLGVMAQKQGSGQLLAEIYAGTSDAAVKRAIFNAFVAGRDTDHFVQAVKAEKSPELRAEGIRMLGARADSGDALVAMYGTETDPQSKRAIIDSLFAQRNAKALVDLARKERDPAMKREFVSRLSSMKSKEAEDYLMELLK